LVEPGKINQIDQSEITWNSLEDVLSNSFYFVDNYFELRTFRFYPEKSRSH